ncbi:MAG TPA: hypothetical protein VM030_01530 [Acidimicrobiales bacterium]|nr:hypothetical protein [Acidimicrobiales bacterium]
MDRRAETDELIAYHGAISGVMTAERTALESALIPVTAYVLVSAAEALMRWPEMIPTIDAAMPAEEIGATGRRPGSRVNAVHLWSVANIFLTGRKFLTLFRPDLDTVDRNWTVLDFWRRAARSYRTDGNLQAWDAGFVLRPYDATIIDELMAGVVPVGDPDQRRSVMGFNATVMAYLFLLYFDTRVGTGDSGPYPLPDGRTLLVRDFYQMATSDFWWADVAAGVPYDNLTCALVLDGVELKVNDWGTSITTPEDYLDHVVGFGLFTTDTPDRSLRPVPLDELDAIVAAVRKAQSAHYRNVAAMTRDEKIRCGAYVYFSFLRPFAEVAGVADDLDWTVPRDSVGPIYDMLQPIGPISTGGAGPPPAEAQPDTAPYYPPLP